MEPSFSKNLGPITVDNLKSLLRCTLINFSGNESFENLLGYKKLVPKTITFIYDKEILSKFEDNSDSIAIICSKNNYKSASQNMKLIVVENAQEAVAILSNKLYRDFNKSELKLLNKPVFGKNCEISENSIIENGVIIEDNVKIDAGSIIGYNCFIGTGCKIGKNTTITHSILSENVEVGSNCSIGQPGFGFYLKKDKNINIYHSGKVIIKSNVNIGSGCTIDRGSFTNTVIGQNTYLDNLCHVAHNVEIGKNCAFAAMTGIAGSAKIGDNVLTGGQAGIAGHITIGDNVQVAAKSGVFNDLSIGESVMGNPAINKYKFLKNYKKIYGKK